MIITNNLTQDSVTREGQPDRSSSSGRSKSCVFFIREGIEMTYSEKLKDPRWIKLAQLVKDQHGNRCDGCGAMGSGIQLDAHHRRYRKGLDPWEYNKFDIAVLCRDCHGTFHKNKERFEELMTNHILYFEWEADQAFKIMEYLLNKVEPNRFRAVLECIVENFEKNTY